LVPNPFIAQLDSMSDALVDMASRARVVSVLDSLPTELEPRLESVRQLTPAALIGVEEDMIPGLRVAPRWFEHEAPAQDAHSSARYVLNFIPREDGSGGRPFPYPTTGSGGKGGATICVSVGAVLCGTIGG
jgi:hypothetical protein